MGISHEEAEALATGGDAVTVPIKIRIKMGSVEVDYEGSEIFLKDDLPGILSQVLKLHQASPTSPPAGNGRAGADPSLNQATTGSIAAKLDTKTGGQLALAAAAYLHLSQGKATFTRQELLDAMKTAAGRYKKTYSDNLSSYLATLAKDGKLLSPGNDSYSLNAGTASDLQKQLAAN